MPSTSPPRHPRAGDRAEEAQRRIDRLITHDVDAQQVFDGVAEELARDVAAEAAWLIHFDVTDSITILGVWSSRELPLPVGTRQAISDELRQFRESAQPYRVVRDDLDSESTFGVEAARLGIAAAVGVPVLLAGQVWALAVVARFSPETFPTVTETRMTSFLEPVTAALAHAWTLTELEEWHAEQAALRRLAELGALQLHPDELVHEASTLVHGRAVVLAHVEDDRRHGVILAASHDHIPVGLRFSTDGDNAAARVIRSGRPERIDDYALAPGGPVADELGVHAVVAAPIEVDGQLWGILAAVSPDAPLPRGTESRLSLLAEVVATAVSTALRRAERQRLVDEQGALLRVSQLVARGAADRELFDAVADGAAGLPGHKETSLARLDGPRTITVLAASGGRAETGVTVTVPPDDPGPESEVIRTHRPARRDGDRVGPVFDPAPEKNTGSRVSVPIIVDGRLWGLLSSRMEDRRLLVTTEDRLQEFAELAAAAIANSQARAEIVQLADEQAALRRVAELVARGASLPEVFAGIAVEATRLLAVGTALLRFEADGYAEIVAAHNGPAHLGFRIPLTDPYIGTMFAAGQAQRLAEYHDRGFAAAVQDLGLAPGVAVPITVEGKPWGVLKTSPSGAALTPGVADSVVSRVADKLEKFAELAAAAIANADNRAQLTASRARIVATADEARQRLQRDVHDGAQQRLVQTVLTLKLARSAAAAGKPTDDLVEEALGYAQRAAADLRDLVHGILPASLSRGGLRRGIESLIADLPMPVELDFSAPRLPANNEITAYFIVAEALTNVVKHAAATRAFVGIGLDTGRLTIEVRDDGTGGADPRRGSGLTGLLDRVETAEGWMTITSPQGAGTLLRASFPVVEP